MSERSVVAKPLPGPLIIKTGRYLSKVLKIKITCVAPKTSKGVCFMIGEYFIQLF